METRYFQTLIMVMEKGSFSKAASALNITQSAASQRIKFLEEQYGQQLIERSGTVLRPTPAGELVLRKARSILAKERELLDELKGFEEKKRLSICCTPTFGMAYLPGALNAFMLQNADVADIKFIFHQPKEAMERLRENFVDLAIIEHFEDCRADISDPVPLPRDELIFVSAPGLGLSETLVNLEDLLSHRIYSRRDGCSSKQLLISNLSAAGKSLSDFRSTVISDDLRFTIETVVNGDGIAFISRSLVAKHIDAGRLQAHHVPGFEHFRSRSALYLPSRRQDPLIVAFLECVRSVFEECETLEKSRQDVGAA